MQVAEAIKCRGMQNKLSAGIQVHMPALTQHIHDLHVLVNGFCYFLTQMQMRA